MRDLIKIAGDVAEGFKSGSDPEAMIVKVANEHNLNAQEIERVVNRANRKIAVHFTKEAAKNNVDPHFVFDTIKTANVIMAIKPKSRAVASVPDSPKPDLSRVFPGAAKPEHRSTVHDNPVELANNPSSEIPSKEIAVSALNILKHRARLSKAKLTKMELLIDDKIREFEKRAYSELLSGTPIEVLRSMPATIEASITKVASQLEDWGHNISSIEDEIEINHGHPLVKMAQDIVFMESDIEEAQEAYNHHQESIKIIRGKL